ncbi:MAG TPA: UbiA family prenyltransferase [Actinomycetota bacterium]|nr:UbiA family prenyltransferase [Actinomycetota bacterium]
MRILKSLVMATHPLPALAVTTLVGAVVAARTADPAAILWAIGSTAAGQASVGWSNDYLDRHRDAAMGRRDKPLVTGDIHPTTVLIGAVSAVALSVFLSLPLGLRPAVVMAAAVGAAWVYNAGLKATLLSWLPYAVAFGLAPVYIWAVTSETTPPAWIVVATAVLGMGGHLLNVAPDLEADRATEIRGLPHRLGLRGSLITACVLLAAVLALVLVAGGRGQPPSGAQIAAAAVAGALIGAVAWAVVRERARLGFRLTLLAAAAIVGTFLLSPAAR